MALLYTSDNSSTGFDATTAGVLPAGWAIISGAWAAETTNPLPGHVNSLQNTSKVDGSIILYTAPSAAADMEVVLAQKLDSSAVSGSNIANCGPIVRSDSAGANLYVAVFPIPAGCISIFKKVAGTYTEIGTSSNLGLSFAAGNILLWRFQIIGSTLNVKMWLSGTVEPSSWSYTLIDSSVSAAGYSGAYAGQSGLSGAVVGFSDFSVDTMSATQAMITLSPTTQAASGGNITISGTYTGTAPSGLNYAIDGGSYTAASSPTIGGGNFSFTIASPANGAHSISVQNSTATTVTDSGIYIITGASTSIAPNNSAIIYSPYNWNVNGTDALTINSGAYFKTLFTGTSCVLNFNVANNLTPLSEIWARVDNGPWTQANVASTVTLTIPSATLSNPDVPYHRLDVYVKSTTETQNRWNTPSGTAVDFQGLTLDAGASVLAPKKFPKNIIVYGDSITEGVRTLGQSATNDVDRNDAMFVWTYEIGELLGAEIANIGFGAQGYTVTGSGNVPVLGSSYNLIYQGVSRTFSPTPNLIVNNMGTNDNATNTTTQATAVINGLLTACPSVPQVLLEPFPATQGSEQTPFLQAAQATCNTPSLVHFVSTTGFFNTAYGADSLNLHPSGPNSTYLIAPQVAAALLPIMNGSGGGSGASVNDVGSGLDNG